MIVSRLLPRLLVAAGLFAVIAAIGPFERILPDPIQDWLDRLSQRNARQPEEKVYLHTDRPMYQPGEVIWFTAYLRDGISLQPSRQSGIVHVELLDPKGSVAQSHELIVRRGLAQGDFPLPAAAPGGVYQLRAYTKWMQNDEDPAIFEKDLQVQAVVTPRLKMKLDFVREAYGPGAAVAADLTLESLSNAPIAGRALQVHLQVQGQTVASNSAITDAAGKARVSAILPAQLDTPDALLLVTLQHNGLTESISRAVPVVLNQIDLAFFPEGGDLLAGQPGRVAFRARNAYGKAADIAGELLNADGQVVTAFSSFHMGRGAFTFTPQAGQAYRVRLTEPFQSEASYELPAALPRGYHLQVSEVTEDAATLRVFSTEQERAALVATVRGAVYHAGELDLAPGENTYHLPLAALPMGVAQLTLFDQRGIPRAERLVFVNHHRQMQVELSTDKDKYLPRERVTLRVRTLDDRGLPLPASVSVAVVDDQLRSFADDRSSTILSWLLVESDLRETVEEPRFYFDPEEEKAPLALDYLLMTAGWRRFTWREIAETPEPVIAQAPEKTLVAGRVLGRNDVPMANVAIEAQGKRYRSDAAGLFAITDIDLYEPVDLLVHVPERDAPIVFPVGNYRDDYLIRTGKVAGQVLGSGGGPLMGATIQVLGTNYGVIADENGRFALDLSQVPQGPLTIRASYIGFEQEDFTFDSPAAVSNLDFVLAENMMVLDEVVVTGAVIQRDRLLNMPAQLEGAVQGVQAGRRRMFQRKEAAVAAVPEPMDDAGPFAEMVLDQEEAAEVMIMEDEVELDADAIVLMDAREMIAPAGRALPASQTRFYRARQFAGPEYVQRSIPKRRTDFRQTLHWAGVVDTDRRGEAELTFYTSDALTAFHVTAEGIGMEGSVGRGEHKFYSQLPVAIDLRVPPLLTALDRVDIPLTLVNHTEERVSGPLTIELPRHLKALEDFPEEISLKPGEALTLYLACEVDTLICSDSLAVSFRSFGFADAMVIPVRNAPRGFPIAQAFSSGEVAATFDLDVTHAVPGSPRLTFAAFPSVAGEIMEGLEGMLREPYGCFEQTSSTTYPNVLVLQYLRSTDQEDPAIAERALSLIQRGYERLMTFESPNGGFEWFGGDPGHEGLTAYGLMEFMDMQQVYDGVDQTMIDRTVEWLLARRDGEGGFRRNPRALHQFGLPNDAVTSTYICYALSEAGITDLAREAEAAYSYARRHKQAYQVALTANLLYNLGQQERAAELLTWLVQNQERSGMWQDPDGRHSAPGSMGQAFEIETTALAMLATMKQQRPDWRSLENAANWLRQQRNGYGAFGNTHSTVLALRALIRYTERVSRAGEAGTIELYLDGDLVASRDYDADQREAIVIDSLQQYLRYGAQQLTVRFQGVREPMPYQASLRYSTDLPPSTDQRLIQIESNLSAQSVKMGETLRLTIRLENTTTEGQAMTIGAIGLPAGLSAQPWQLKELLDQGQVDFYEIAGQELRLYYRQMAPEEEKTIHLDLKAEIPGRYVAQATHGYLYYTDEWRHWVRLPEVMVLP